MGALLILGGCAVPLQGVVQADGRATYLDGAEGQRYRLMLNEYSAPVSHLDRCTVEVSGPRIARRVLVRDWEVLAAADGSAPFLGRLEVHGSNLLLHDRASGSTLILEGPGTDALRVHDDQLMMIIGFVVAPHVVRVMGAQALE